MAIEVRSKYADESLWDTVLSSPEYLLHSIDPRRGTFEFLHTSRSTLSDNTFIDGRTCLSQDPKITLPIKEVVDWKISNPAVAAQPNRLILHMSFCGSTLAARVFDIENRSFTYKEPQALLQLAELKAANTRLYQDRQQWQQLVSFTLAQFKLPWSEGEINIVKPSNWLNSMLQQLTSDGGRSRVILLRADAPSFLTAVFRGGGERIQFTYSVLKHLQTAFPEYKQTISSLEKSDLDSADLFARLCLVAHAIQLKAFNRLEQIIDASQIQNHDFKSFLSQPQIESSKMRSALQLPISDHQLQRSVASRFRHHSKITTRDFRTHQAKQVDELVNENYRDCFNRALAWAEQALSPSQFM